MSSPDCTRARRSSCGAEADNPHDPNAIAVHYGQLQLGFFNKRLAAHIAPLMDAGARYGARVASLTGGPSTGPGQAELAGYEPLKKHRGVNVAIEREALGVQLLRADGATQRPGAEADAAETGERVRCALIGASVPHEAQRAVLERVEAGKNTLAVLGTGRGKSFCFQYAAAMRAFSDGQKTLVIYPLRALANDQFEAIRRTLEPWRPRLFRANGSISPARARRTVRGLRRRVGCRLATPSSSSFHRDAIVAGARRRSWWSTKRIISAESRHRRRTPAWANHCVARQATGTRTDGDGR